MTGYVYLVRNGDLHKIGRTDNIQRRMKQLDPDEVIQVLETDRSRDLEHELHKEFQTKRLPQSEYFRLDEAEINAARIALGWDPEGPVMLPEIPWHLRVGGELDGGGVGAVQDSKARPCDCWVYQLKLQSVSLSPRNHR